MPKKTPKAKLVKDTEEFGELYSACMDVTRGMMDCCTVAKQQAKEIKRLNAIQIKLTQDFYRKYSVKFAKIHPELSIHNQT